MARKVFASGLEGKENMTRKEKIARKEGEIFI